MEIRTKPKASVSDDEYMPAKSMKTAARKNPRVDDAAYEASDNESPIAPTRRARTISRAPANPSAYLEVASDIEDESDDGDSSQGEGYDGRQQADVEDEFDGKDDGKDDDLDRYLSHHTVLSIVENDFIDSEIRRLKDAIPGSDDLYLAKLPVDLTLHNVPWLQSELIEEYCPTGGKVWRSGLLYWLRSASVLPIIKLWSDVCVEDEETFSLLENFLPPKQYPWKQQLKQVTDLAKLPDAGKSKEDDIPRVVSLCAIYTRKLFLCNFLRLLSNGPSSNDYVWHHMLDIPCAVLFTAYHDIVSAAPGQQTFFGVLLASPLARALHQDIRKAVETFYPSPSPYFHRKDRTRFWTAAPDRKADGSVQPRDAADAIDNRSCYEHDPFSDEEQLLFCLAHREETRVSRAFRIDVERIVEILPGRCEDEVHEFHKRQKVNLGLVEERRVVIAQTGEGDDRDVVAVKDAGDTESQHSEEVAEAEEESEDDEVLSVPPRDAASMTGTVKDALALFAACSGHQIAQEGSANARPSAQDQATNPPFLVAPTTCPTTPSVERINRPRRHVI